MLLYLIIQASFSNFMLLVTFIKDLNQLIKFFLCYKFNITHYYYFKLFNEYFYKNLADIKFYFFNYF